MKTTFARFAGTFLLFILGSCQSQNSEPSANSCAYFHVGTFKYVGSEDVRIERTSTHQIEYNLKGEGGYIYTDKYAITWINECEYYLTLESTDHPEDLNFSKNDTMWTKITKVSRTGYSFTSVKNKEIFTGELKKTDS